MGRPERLQLGKESSGYGITPRWTSFRVLYAHEQRNQKGPSVVAEERKQEFVRAESDRDTTIHELTEGSCRAGESPASFAHDVCRLAKVAYPGIGADALDTIARD